jgi:hypothetical protein
MSEHAVAIGRERGSAAALEHDELVAQGLAALQRRAVQAMREFNDAQSGWAAHRRATLAA